MKATRRLLESATVLRRFLPEVALHRRALVSVLGLSCVTAVFDLLRPWPIQWIFDGALAPVPGDHPPLSLVIWTGVGAVLFIVLGKALAEYFRELGIAATEHAFTRHLRYRVFAHLTRLSPLYHARHKSGDLIVRLMGDVPQVSTMMIGSAVELATRAAVIIGTLTVMTVLDPLLTGILVSGIPILLLTVRFIARHLTIAVRKQRRKEGDLADYLHEAIAATPMIQSVGGSEQVVRTFARTNRRNARAGLKAKKLAARLAAAVESLLGVSLAATLLIGSFRVTQGVLTPGELLVFLSYVRSLLKPVRAASKHSERVAKGSACGERILAMLDQTIEVSSPAHGTKAPLHPKELTLSGVSFAYPDGTRALSDISTSFRTGELTALVGKNGAGKSTLAYLAARLVDPVDGALTIDGCDLREVDLDSLRGCVALSLQRTVLLGVSVRDNLLLARPDAEDAELVEALRATGVDEFLDLPADLDLELGAEGAGLSGGQQSRLALARTLLRGARVVLVDEPFAGLDSASTEQARHVLRGLSRDRIVVVIAHDLARLDEFDRVVFLEDGRISAAGRHTDLYADSAAYRAVVREEVAAS